VQLHVKVFFTEEDFVHSSVWWIKKTFVLDKKNVKKTFFFPRKTVTKLFSKKTSLEHANAPCNTIRFGFC